MRRAFDAILDRLSQDPGIDHLTIFEDFLSANAELRLYLSDAFLVTFVVRDDRILVLDVVHTMDVD